MAYDRATRTVRPSMRLRIVHQLSLLLIGAVLMAVLAVGGLVAWNLQAGFSDYLAARDQSIADRFASLIATRLGGEAPAITLESGRLPMRELVDELARLEGIPVAPKPKPPAVNADGPFDRPPPGARKGEFAPKGAGPGGLGQRLQVVTPDGRRVGGPPLADDRPRVESPIVVGGRTVAMVRMAGQPVPESVDARFLRRQYLGITIAGVITLTLALIAAWLVAPRMGRPLRALQSAAHRIAGGELDVRVPESGSREMADLIADMNRMTTALERLEGARRTWIAQISHELRTPLSVLRGELESIEDGARAPTPDVIGRLRAEVMTLVRLIGDLHTLSMADLGALPCTFADGDADAALFGITQRLAPRVQARGLVIEVARSGPARCRWDFGRIDQLLVNLIENSVRYTTVPGKVRVHWSTQADTVELRIDDTPPAVATADLDQLFEPLFRVDRARSRTADDRGSSGLGLAIVRAIAVAHGGGVRAEHSPLGGLAVIVHLPCHPEAA